MYISIFLHIYKLVIKSYLYLVFIPWSHLAVINNGVDIITKYKLLFCY
jgi:hypothetical protein